MHSCTGFQKYYDGVIQALVIRFGPSPSESLLMAMSATVVARANSTNQLARISSYERSKNA